MKTGILNPKSKDSGWDLPVYITQQILLLRYLRQVWVGELCEVGGIHEHLVGVLQQELDNLGMTTLGSLNDHGGTVLYIKGKQL